MVSRTRDANGLARTLEGQRRARVPQAMRVEYDTLRDLLYIAFAEPEVKAAKTLTVMPGVHADFSVEGKLIGIEVIDAVEVVGRKIGFALPEVSRPSLRGAT